MAQFRTISNATLADLIEQAAEWAKMTDENCHSEVRCNIAAFFEETEIFGSLFKFMLKDGLTIDDTRRREQVMEHLLENIELEHGETVVGIVRAAL